MNNLKLLTILEMANLRFCSIRHSDLSELSRFWIPPLLIKTLIYYTFRYLAMSVPDESYSHISAKALATWQMIPSGINSPPAEISAQ
jgi:hypothetical protein